MASPHEHGLQRKVYAKHAANSTTGNSSRTPARGKGSVAIRAGSSVTQTEDYVQVVGFSKVEVEEALQLFNAGAKLRAERGEALAHEIEQTAALANVDLIDPVPLEQARRRINVRQALLATPVYTTKTLSEVRGDKMVSSTRTWAYRAQARRKIFMVRQNGTVLIPAFQLTDDGQPRPELAPLLDTLMSAGITEWTLWVWLTSTTPLLSGQVPYEVALEGDDARALSAARRFVARDREQ